MSVTLLVPCDVPRFVPVMTNPICTGPWVSERLAIPGVTVNVLELLATPFIVTISGPVVAPNGTGTVMLAALQFVGAETTVPLKVMLLFGGSLEPKPLPAMVTDVLVTDVVTGPLFGEGTLMTGTTVSATALLAIPPTVTTTFPEVAAAGTWVTMLVPLDAQVARLPAFR